MKNKFKKIIIIFFIVAAAFAAGGYFVYQKYFSVNEDENWMNEIALGQECGIDGMRCCKDKKPECNYSTCCIDPGNSKKDLCLSDCTCGKEKHFCCPGEKCDQGLACVEGVCHSCGGKEQPCCGGESCNKDLLCSNGSCVLCGLPGNPCCTQGPACADENKTDVNRSECQKNICVVCGSVDKAVCLKNPACSKGLLATNGYCLACGNLNQPCCGMASGEKICLTGLSCKLGFCSE